jgi:hypothetical protein
MARRTLLKLANLALVSLLLISLIPFSLEGVEAQGCVVIQKVGFDSTPPFSVGDSVYFAAIVSNSCASPQAFQVGFYIDGQLWDSGLISLAGGETTTIGSDHAWATTIGSHILIFTAGESRLSRSFDVIGTTPEPVQSSSECNVSTDKSTYSVGDIVTIETSPPPALGVGWWYSSRPCF